MNVRIKELALQAGIMFESTKVNRVHSISTDTLEKFAELILSDSLNVLSMNGYDDARVCLEQEFGINKDE